MEHMSVLDAAFVYLDRPSAPLHVGSVMVFEGPPPQYTDVIRAYDARLHLVPRYRQKVRKVPLHVATPVWVDDPHFSIDYHLRHTALPRPGDGDQLRRLVGRVMGIPLDFRRPLWETWMVEGLEGDRWALINKTHHCMVDGMSGADIASLLMSREPGAPIEPGPPWSPAPEPSERELALDGVTRAITHPLHRAAHIVDLIRTTPKATVARSAHSVKGASSLVGSVGPEPFGLNGSIGPNRRWTWVRGSLADVKAVRAATGATVNDVILSAITLGFRRWLLDRGQDLAPDSVVTSLVPVSTRSRGTHASHDNQVSGMLADLPVGIEDPLDVGESVKGQLHHLKTSGESVSVALMIKAGDFVPSSLYALGSRVAAQTPQRAVSTVTTNVPGTPWPLYLLHSQMVEAFPYIPLANRMRVTIGIFTYAGGVHMGITGDYDAMGDLDALGDHIEAAQHNLVEAATAKVPSSGESASQTPGAPSGTTHDSPDPTQEGTL